MPYDKQVACENISDRAIGYGMPGVTVNGNDPLEVYQAVKEARERARRGEGPTLIETISYRLTPHSSDDDDSSYRGREEVEEAKKSDPLLTYQAYLKETGLLSDEIEQTMLDEIMAIVNEATDEAENAPYAAPESVLDYVYAK
nr:thiamine pyrophosphate-dependent enzyme [Bacillus subtilis]